jgi:hypothetical protein
MKVKNHRQMMRSLTDPLNIPKLRALLEAHPVLTQEEFKARQTQLIPEEWDELSPKEERYYQQGPFSTHEDFRGAKGGTVPQLVQPGPGRQGYAESSWNVGKTHYKIDDLDAGAKHYKYKDWETLNTKVNKARAAGDKSDEALKLRRNRDAITAQIRRKKKWIPPDIKMRGGAEAEWLDAVAEKIIDYTDNKDPKVFISHSERAYKPGSPTIEVKGSLNQNQSKQFAKATDQQIAWLAEKSGVSRTIIKNAQTKYNAIPASERRAQVITEAQLKNMQAKVKIQSDILEQMNKGVFNSRQMAKNLNIGHTKLINESEKLIRRIYSDNMKIRKGLIPSGVGLPQDLTKNEALLQKIWKVEGFQGPEQRNWYKLVRDAFDSDRITRKQFILANDNITNFYRMKNQIQAKYPNLVLNLDHPLSHGALKSLGASGEKFLTGVPTTERFNKGIKEKLDIGYKNVTADVRQGVPGAAEKKIGIEKLAKNLNIDIGEISPTGKKVVSLGKRNIVFGDEKKLGKNIIQSLKEQNILAKKIKNIDPALTKAADMEGYFKKTKLPTISKKEIQGVTKILKEAGIRCSSSKGGDCPIEDYRKSFNEVVQRSAAGDPKALTKLQKFTQTMKKLKGPAKWTGYGILGEIGFMVPFAVGDYATGKSWKRILGNASDWGFGPMFGQSEDEEIIANLPEDSLGAEAQEALAANTRLEALTDPNRNFPKGRIGMDPKRFQEAQTKVIEEADLDFLTKITPFMEGPRNQYLNPLKLDEAFLDWEGAQNLIKEQEAQRIQERRDRGFIAEEGWEKNVLGRMDGGRASYLDGGIVSLLKK